MSIKDDIEAALRYLGRCSFHANAPERRGLTELRRIVEALPKSGTGGPLLIGRTYHGIDLARRPFSTMIEGYRMFARDDEGSGDPGDWIAVGDDGVYDGAHCQTLYETPEAAEAAHRLANGPHDHDDADGRAGEPDA